MLGRLPQRVPYRWVSPRRRDPRLPRTLPTFLRKPVPTALNLARSEQSCINPPRRMDDFSGYSNLATPAIRDVDRNFKFRRSLSQFRVRSVRQRIYHLARHLNQRVLRWFAMGEDRPLQIRAHTVWTAFFTSRSGYLEHSL